MPTSTERFRVAVPYPYKYSKPVDPKLYENDDYLFNVATLISIFFNLTDAVIWDIRDEWAAGMNESVEQLNNLSGDVSSRKGGNLVAVFFPESTKEKILPIVYCCEYNTIHDGTSNISSWLS